jgi:LysM repeat protein
MKIKIGTFLGALCLAVMIAFSASGTGEVSADYYGYNHYHTVHWGETLWGIANWHGVTVNDILAYNPHISNPHWIPAGSTIYVPAAYHHPYQDHTHYCSYYHTVQYGQTLSHISAWYGRTIYDIAHVNGIYNFDYIYTGQTLCIP